MGWENGSPAGANVSSPRREVFKSNDSVLNGTQKRNRLSLQLFAFRQSLEAPLS